MTLLETAQKKWNGMGCLGKGLTILGALFIFSAVFGRKDQESRVSDTAAAPSDTVPAPTISVDDARLYIPSSLPGFQTKSGFDGSTNTEEEALLRAESTDGVQVRLLANRNSSPIESMGATDPIWTEVGGHKAYQSKSGPSWATTWKRGSVVLRVSAENASSSDTDLKASSLRIARMLNQRADAVAQMSAEERATSLVW